MKYGPLIGKNIIFISVKFFNYENFIKSQLEEMGANVDLFDERPSNSFFSKAVIRIRKEIYFYKINSYFRQIINRIKEVKYDYFLLIKGEATPQFFIDFLREINPKIELIYYTYDSFKNNSNGLKILANFDRRFTFDSEDAKNYNMNFRPLFYVSDYHKLYYERKSIEYDLAFIGTAHSDRYLISENASAWCRLNNLKMFTFYFSPSRALFKYKKIFDKGFRDFNYKKISFNSLSHDEVIGIYKKSKVILDINHPGQNGLTMRTFETLGSGRKLITTNPNIKHYPFYNPKNIFVIERGSIRFDEKFFESEFEEISESLLHSMSLKGWIEELFGIQEVTLWKDIVK